MMKFNYYNGGGLSIWTSMGYRFDHYVFPDGQTLSKGIRIMDNGDIDTRLAGTKV